MKEQFTSRSRQNPQHPVGFRSRALRGDSSFSDKTTGREDGLLKIRFAKEIKIKSSSICFKRLALREAEFELPVLKARAFARQTTNHRFPRHRSPTGSFRLAFCPFLGRVCAIDGFGGRRRLDLPKRPG